jgi:hypothetical protein
MSRRSVNVFAGEGVAAAMMSGQQSSTSRKDLQAHGLGGYGGKQLLAAAGGRANNVNARPDGVGHTRGNLHGASTRVAGDRAVEEAFEKFLHSERIFTPPYTSSQAPAAQSGQGVDFLERVGLAEKRDQVEAAAAQIAAEEQLGPAQQAALALKMLSHVSGPGRHSSTDGAVAAVSLSPERPHNPIKGHGACNPEVPFTPNLSRTTTGGIQYMPNMGGSHTEGARSNHPGAAGLASSENWRLGDYMAHGAEGYGDFRSEHLALKPRAKLMARNLQPRSQVVFGDRG